MDQAQTTNASAKHASPWSSPTAWGVMAIVFGVLLPPLGLLLAAMTIYKAGVLAKRNLLILGLLGIAAVIGGSFMYNWAYDERHKSTINNTYTYTGYETYKLTGTGKGSGMSFTKPSVFQYLPGSTITPFQAGLVQQVNLPGHTARSSVASIDSSIVIPTVTISDTYLNGLDNSFSADGQKQIRYKVFKNGLQNWILGNVAPRSAITMADAQKFTSESIKDHAWSFDYTTASTNADGTPKNLKGRVVFAVGKKYYYYFSVVAVNANWDANASTWQTVFNSLKIDQ